MANSDQATDHNRERIVILERQIRQLKEEAEFYAKFVVECTELIPEGYDGDDSAESIILQYLKDMDKLAGIVARLTSAYR
jgi:hypothetical protein